MSFNITEHNAQRNSHGNRFIKTKSVVILIFSKCKYLLPYYRGHYVHDTPVTMSYWPVTVLTVFMYSISLLMIKIYFKEQNRV